MGRHANGEGTIYRRKDGRYEAAAYLLTTSGNRKRVRKVGKTRQEAQEKLAKVKAQSQQGVPVPDKDWKLGEYLDYWLDIAVRPKRRPKTFEQCEAITRLYLKPALAQYSLTQLSVLIVQGFIDQQLAAGRPAATVHKIRKVLSAALTYAMRQELVFRNVARLVELPHYKPTAIQPWTVEETTTFLRAAESEPLHAAYVLLTLYGLRRGEVLGLRWCDIDFENEVIHVRQQLQRVGGELRLADLKAEAGRRDEPLVQSAADALTTQRHKQTLARKNAGDAWHSSGSADELVFTTGTGRPIEPRNFYRSFQRICTANGLRRIKVHHVRHTNATLQMNLGTPDKHIQAILGHADVSTTKRLYEHSDLKNQRDALEKVERLFWRGVDSVRCRQNCRFLPSSLQIVEQITSFISGAEDEVRTRDPRLTITANSSIYERATAVNRLVNERQKTWLLGLVAVSVAVKIREPLER